MSKGFLHLCMLVYATLACDQHFCGTMQLPNGLFLPFRKHLQPVGTDVQGVQQTSWASHVAAVHVLTSHAG